MARVQRARTGRNVADATASHGWLAQLRGISDAVENLPSPARAERNQRRKLAFVPAWPVVAGLVLVVALIMLAR